MSTQIPIGLRKRTLATSDLLILTLTVGIIAIQIWYK